MCFKVSSPNLPFQAVVRTRVGVCGGHHEIETAGSLQPLAEDGIHPSEGMMTILITGKVTKTFIRK
jgi:hypothetical protein